MRSSSYGKTGLNAFEMLFQKRDGVRSNEIVNDTQSVRHPSHSAMKSFLQFLTPSICFDNQAVRPELLILHDSLVNQATLFVVVSKMRAAPFLVSRYLERPLSSKALTLGRWKYAYHVPSRLIDSPKCSAATFFFSNHQSNSKLQKQMHTNGVHSSVMAAKRQCIACRLFPGVIGISS